MNNLWQDLRHGFRLLGRAPGFTAVAILTLGIGIGANTAIFSVVNALFLHPPGMDDPSQIVALRVRYTKLNLKSIGVSATDFADVDRSRHIFSSAAILSPTDFSYQTGSGPVRLHGAAVSWKWFDVFGARPALGRVFNPQDDQPGANHEVVLAYDTWQQMFGGDPQVVGRTILLNNEPYRVIGVVARDFDWPSQTRLWVPLGLAATEFTEQNRYNESYFGMARLRPGVSPERAGAWVGLLTERNIEHGPQGSYGKDAGWAMFLVPFTNLVYGDLKIPMLTLMGAVGFVLLIACANIAGLMLARATGRQKEITLRAVLGAERWDLIRPTLVQGLLLAGGGTVLGLLLGWEGIRALLLLAPQQVSQGLAVPMDAYVLLFTAVAGILSGLLFAIAPALRASELRDFTVLKEGGRSGTAGRARQRLRSVLVVGQMALALVLLVGLGLLAKSWGRMQEVRPGFDPNGVMTAEVSLPNTAFPDKQKEIAFFRATAGRLAAEPGVVASALAVPVPFSGFNPSASFEIEGQPIGPGNPGPHGDVRWVSPGYFAAMKIPVVAGREFAGQDVAGGQMVAVIDQNLARQYWPRQNPIGQRIRRGSRAPWATIVGVVGHVKQSALVGDSGKGVYYYSLFQQGGLPAAFVLARSGGKATAVAAALQDAVHAIEPSLPVFDLKSMAERVEDSLAPERFAVSVLGFFAAIALVLAALGLYGVISYSVTQRTQEIGVRMALGADRRRVLAMVVGQGMRLAAIGVGIGCVAAYGVARLLATELFGVNAGDPETFLGVAVLLAAVAWLACYVPARRATRVDPMIALRYE
ncbi:MAG: ABC transporter permease [Acidobacteriota bacterium]|nr:ABC transporter permease [Acidobacteriota bacterium]